MQVFGSSTGWEDKVVMGDGWAYGLELLAQKSIGKTTGWVGYTWSKADRLFNRPGQELNYGKVFPAKYDRRHDISLVLSHKFSDKLDISGTWVFSTGNTGTLALQHYVADEIYGNNSQADQEVDSKTYDPRLSGHQELGYISSRNNYRFNPYHRMDIGVNLHKQKKHGIRTWNFSIYNVYNNNNPFLVYPKEEMVFNPTTSSVSTKTVFSQLSLFPIIPSVSYSYKW